MKKKGLTIGLALVVISIWGAVLAKAMKPRTRTGDSGAVLNEGTAVIPAAVDTLPEPATLGNYRDPFLGEVAAPPRVQATGADDAAVVKRKQAAVVPAPTFTWPTIVFKGMLKNNHNGQGVALITVNGKDRMLVTGKEEDGITLLAVGRDSITVKASGEQRRFGR